MKPRKVFFIMLGVLGVTFAASAGGFYLMDSSLSAKAIEINDLRTDLEVLDKKIEASRDAGAELTKFKDVVKIIDNVLPPDKIQADIVAEIFDIADDNNAAIGTITFPGSTDTNNFELSQTAKLDGVPGVLFVQINMDVTASFNDMLNMLQDFEKNQRKMQVTTVSIATEVDEDGNPIDSFTVNMSIYVYQRAE